MGKWTSIKNTAGEATYLQIKTLLRDAPKDYWYSEANKRRQIRVVDSKDNDSRVVPINKMLYNVAAK